MYSWPNTLFASPTLPVKTPICRWVICKLLARSTKYLPPKAPPAVNAAAVLISFISPEAMPSKALAALEANDEVEPAADDMLDFIELLNFSTSR